jgi:hypothetical protein
VTAWEHHVPLAFHLGREADHSPPSSAEVKEWVELYLHSPTTPSWRGARLGGAQWQLYLYLCLGTTPRGHTEILEMNLTFFISASGAGEVQVYVPATSSQPLFGLETGWANRPILAPAKTRILAVQSVASHFADSKCETFLVSW